MARKFYILIILFLIALISGIFVFLKFRKNEASGSMITTKTPTSSKSIEPVFPKVSKFKVPILMYHYIRNAEGESELGKNLSVSPENFEAQVKWLKDDDYTPVKLADLADPEKKAISKAIYEKKKPIVFTFDDGYEDAYTEAFPVLKKYEFIGTFFIIRNSVGKPEYMTQTQMDELEKAGNEIGSHSLSHPDLAKIDVSDAQAQISNSKNNALTFCYPAGKYNSTIVALVKDAGYLAAVTTKIGIARETSKLFELPRVRVENTSAQTLVDKINYALEQ